jgi:hypothetical protein
MTNGKQFELSIDLEQTTKHEGKADTSFYLAKHRYLYYQM